MKIRNGFVSNSSSSSFLAIGIKIPYPDEKDMLGVMSKALDIPEADIIKKIKEEKGTPLLDELDDWDIKEFCQEWIWEINFKDHGIEIISDRDCEQWLLIGKEVGSSYNDSIEAINTDFTEITKTIETVRDRMGLTGTTVQLYLGGLIPGC